LPGPPHESMVVLLREHPDWLRALVEIVAKRHLPTALSPVDSAVRVVDPADVRPDLVFVASDQKSWLLVEVQLDEDDTKTRRWPLAVAALWNERKCPGDLLVITADRAVARWAHKIGRMTGPLGGTLAVQPVVVQLTSDVAEVLLDAEHPELAFFAAWTVHDRHGPEALAIVERATELIETLPDPALRKMLIRSILGMLSEKLLKRLREVSMDLDKIPVSPALQRMGEEFQAKYGAQIEARGEARGRALGEALGEARMLLKILAVRGLSVDPTTEARVRACTDLATLERWAERAVTAATLDAVFRD